MLLHTNEDISVGFSKGTIPKQESGVGRLCEGEKGVVVATGRTTKTARREFGTIRSKHKKTSSGGAISSCAVPQEISNKFCIQ
jgi:hypothetical protein